MYLNLNSVEKVKSFVEMVSKVDTDVMLSSGRYKVDAKSILGIFSLDLSLPLKLTTASGKMDEKLESIAQRFQLM